MVGSRFGIYYSLALLFGAGLTAAAADFADVRGWSFITWDMGAAQVKAALKAQGIRFQEKLLHKDGVVVLAFVRDGWDGSVYFDGGKVSQILFQSPHFATAEEAAAAIATYTAQYGPAHETRTLSYGDRVRADTFYIWRNDATVLTVTAAHYIREGKWVVWENYVPAAPAGGREDKGPAFPGEWMNQPPDMGE